MSVAVEVARFQGILLEIGRSRLPLIGVGHARHLVRQLRRPPKPLASKDDREGWKGSCDRIAERAIKAMVEKGQLEPHLAHNFAFGYVIDAPAPLRWSPGDDDPDFVRLQRTFRAYVEQAKRPQPVVVKAFFVPSRLGRPSLALPLFREAIRIAEQEQESHKYEPIFQALRVATTYVTLARDYPEAAATWEITDENLFSVDSPIVPEAYIKVEGRTIAIRTVSTVGLNLERINAFHARMKQQAQEYWLG
jgi:hypothetical protein